MKIAVELMLVVCAVFSLTVYVRNADSNTSGPECVALSVYALALVLTLGFLGMLLK